MQSLNAQPSTVLKMRFAFDLFAKKLKLRYPMVLQLSFAFWQSWQMREQSWHFCQTQDNLPNADGPHPA